MSDGETPLGERVLFGLMGFAWVGGGYRALQELPGWVAPFALFLMLGGLVALAAAVLPNSGSATPTAPPLSPADEVAAARADAAAQIEAVRAEIAERDAQRRREMDERIARMRAAQAPPPATAWE